MRVPPGPLPNQNTVRPKKPWWFDGLTRKGSHCPYAFFKIQPVELLHKAGAGVGAELIPEEGQVFLARVFEIRERAPRQAQNPKTLERVDVPARRTVKFKTGRLMKNKVEGTEV